MTEDLIRLKGLQRRSVCQVVIAQAGVSRTGRTRIGRQT